MNLKKVKPYALAVFIIAYFFVSILTYKLVKVGAIYIKEVWNELIR